MALILITFYYVMTSLSMNCFLSIKYVIIFKIKILLHFPVLFFYQNAVYVNIFMVLNCFRRSLLWVASFLLFFFPHFVPLFRFYPHSELVYSCLQGIQEASSLDTAQIYWLVWAIPVAVAPFQNHSSQLFFAFSPLKTVFHWDLNLN